MGVQPRHKTQYPGVFFRMVDRIGKTGQEKVYYIVFKKDGKVIEEKVGRQFSDNMSPAKASSIRSERIEGKRLSRKEVRQQLQEAEQNKPLTIGELWLHFWEYRKKSSTAVRLDRTDEYNYLKYLTGYVEKLPSDLRTEDINKLRERLLTKKKSPQTVKHILNLLKRIINFGIKNSLCPSTDPSLLYFKFPKVDNQKTETLDEAQLKKYIEALNAEPDQNAAGFLKLALVTGMRKGALMALRWDDIDFENGFITLRGDSAKKRKTEKIPMSPATHEILKSIAQTSNPFIFPGKDGGQRKVFRKIANRVKEAAGLPKDFRPLHGLRHAFASRKASSGEVDLYTLQKLLTHSTPAMTQRYAHLADEALKRAAKVADNIFAMSDPAKGNAE